MTAFDTAWALLKMPLFHGTTEDRLESIMREGLKPYSELPWGEWDRLVQEGVIDEDEDGGTWLYTAVNDLSEPGKYAGWGLASQDGRYGRGWKPNVAPVILEIPDRNPHEWTRDWTMDEDHEWLRTQETVDPEHITVALRGRPGMTAEEWEEMWRAEQERRGFETPFEF